MSVAAPGGWELDWAGVAGFDASGLVVSGFDASGLVVSGFDASGLASGPEPCSEVASVFSWPLATGSPFLSRRGFEEFAPCCAWLVVEPAYARGRSDIKSVAVKTAESDARTALNFILETPSV